MPFDVLHTILDSGLRNVFEKNPMNTQTGPARRTDTKVIQSQTKELSQKFYDFIQSQQMQIHRDLSFLHTKIQHYFVYRHCSI